MWVGVGGRNGVRIQLGQKFTPFYEKGIKKSQNRSMELQIWLAVDYIYIIGNLFQQKSVVVILYPYFFNTMSKMIISLITFLYCSGSQPLLQGPQVHPDKSYLRLKVGFLFNIWELLSLRLYCSFYHTIMYSSILLFHLTTVLCIYRRFSCRWSCGSQLQY